MRLRRILLPILAALGATAALGQGTIEQSGPVTNGHVPSWTGNGVVQDGGGPNNPAVNALGVYDGAECPLGVNSQTGPGASTSPYAQTKICQTGTASTFTFSGLNGAPTPNIYFSVGGVLYPFPFAGSTSIFVVPNASNFGTQHLGTYQSVYLAAYGNGSRALADGGEGMFTQGVPCANDGGITGLNDADGHLFCRTNQNGSLAQAGITVGSPYDTTTCADRSACTAADSKVSAAFVAAAAAGLHSLHSKGVSFLISGGNLAIPDNMTLDCDVIPAGQRQQAGPNAQPYPSLPGFVVLNPTFSITGPSTASIRNCGVLPTWYTTTLINSVTTTRILIDSYSHALTGTAIKFGDTSRRYGSSNPTIENVQVIGFDTCIDVTNTPQASYAHLSLDCNVPFYNHAQGGGMNLTDATAKTLVESQFVPSSVNLKEVDYGITAIAADGSNRATFTYPSANDQIVQGDSVFIGGLGETVTTALVGTLNSSTTISNLPNDPEAESNIYSVLMGAAVTDTDSGDSACIPANTVVRTINLGNQGQNDASVTINNAATCNRTSASLQFLSRTSAPQALNGFWQVAAHANNGDGTSTITATGSSYTGPTTDASTNWISGATAVKVLSTVNIGVGQYLCTPGTAASAPFCTAPPGWTVAATTLSDNIGTGSNSSVHFASTTNWPTLCSIQQCVIKITTGGTPETLSYTKINGDGTVNLGRRGLDGTTAASHNSGDAVVVAAPQVLGVAYAANGVLLNSNAQSTQSGQAVTFANDPTVSCTVCGQISLTAAYHYWTANTVAGPAPSDRFQALGAASGTTALTVSAPVAARVQPGMTVTDVTTPGNIPSASGTAISVSGTTITLSGNLGTFASDTISFTGCGYPTNQPWLGNCTATAFLFSNSASGTTVNGINAHGWRVYFHLNSAQQTFATSPVFDSGGIGGLGDPGSVGEWIEGNGDKIDFVGGKIAAWNGIIVNPSSVGSGVSIAAQNLRTATVAVTNMGIMNTASLHGSGAALVYLDSSQTSFLTSSTNLPTMLFEYDNPLNTALCAASIFADTWCTGSSGGSTGFIPGPTPPTPSSGWVTYVDQTDGALKAKASNGTIIVIGTP